MNYAISRQLHGEKDCATIIYNPAILGDAPGPIAQCRQFLNSMTDYLSAPSQVRTLAYRSVSGIAPLRLSKSCVAEIDFVKAEIAMRTLATEQGLDFDGLVKDASSQFQQSIVRPTCTKLSDADIRNLVDDDDQAINS